MTRHAARIARPNLARPNLTRREFARRVLMLAALPSCAAIPSANIPSAAIPSATAKSEPMPDTPQRDAPQLIDDSSAPDLSAATGTKWRLVTDQVMGGVSEARVRRTTVVGRAAVHLTGEVSLANNGGFVQTTLDLRPDGGPVDASAWTGIELTVRGNGQTYNLHLRTTDVRRPWQSYRHSFPTAGEWQTVRLPFDGFEAHRIDAPLDLSRLKRIGLVAIGREFRADLAVAELRVYA